MPARLLHVLCSGPGRATARGRLAACTPGQVHSPFGISGRTKADRLRGGRQGWAATPAPPARDYVPWNPDSMRSYAERLVRMLTGRLEKAAII